MSSTVKRFAAIAVAAFAAVGVVGCASGGDNGGTETIRLGLAPDEDSAAVLAKFEPFVAYLEERTGYDIEPYVGADYTAVIEAMNSGQLEMAWFGPSEYVLASNQVGDGVEAFASALQDDDSVPYQASFIVRDDSDIQGVEDFEGKAIAFTDPASTSGHIFARYELVNRGVVGAETFSAEIYSGSHDASLMAVKNGQVDIGVVSSRKLPSFYEKGLVDEGAIRVVLESVEIPADPMSVSANLSDEAKAAFREALLSDNPALEASLEGTGFQGFGPVGDSDYDVVRAAYATAGL